MLRNELINKLESLGDEYLEYIYNNYDKIHEDMIKQKDFELKESLAKDRNLFTFNIYDGGSNE